MAPTRTLAMIKPDAIKHTEEILNRARKMGFRIVAEKSLRLTPNMVQHFYIEHARKPFFPDLQAYMTSGNVHVAVLELEDDAVRVWRRLLGATNPQDAADGTIRGDFGTSINANAAHGTDSEDATRTEIPFFFARYELME